MIATEETSLFPTFFLFCINFFFVVVCGRRRFFCFNEFQFLFFNASSFVCY